MGHVKLFLGAGFALPLVIAAIPARAADIVKCLPDDAKRVISFNIRHYLDSPLAEKENVNRYLEADKQAQKFLTAIGLDPLKDLDRIVFAGADNPNNGVMVIIGKFDAKKIHARAKETAQKKGKLLKVHKTDFGALYEIPDLDLLVEEVSGWAREADAPVESLFMAVVDDKTAIVSGSKESVQDALARAAGKKEVRLKHDDLPALVAAMDPKQTLAVAIPGSALKHIKAKSITGGFAMEADVKIDLKIAAENAKMAKKLNRNIGLGMHSAKFFIGSGAGDPLLWPEAKGPLLEIARAVKHEVKGTDVIVKGEIKSETLIRLLATWPE